MKKMTLLTAFMGLALVFGTASKSEAWCIFGGCADKEVYNDSSRTDSDNIGGDQVGGDKFDRLADTITDSFVVTNNSQVAEASGNTTGDVGDLGKVANSASNFLGNIDKSHDNDVNINNTIGDNNVNEDN